ILIVLLMICTLSVPALRRWPWVWLAPVTTYLLVVMSVPSIRGSLNWFCLGRLSAAAVAATFGIMAFTAAGLLVYHASVQSNVRSYREFLPLDTLGRGIVAGAVFATVNATLEELVFRGVLFDAVHSQWGMWGTLIGTAMLFGLGHLHGYPPGLIGAC